MYQESTNGLLWKDGTLIPPSPEVKETLMGFTSGDTDAPGLSLAQRTHLLGKCTDLQVTPCPYHRGRPVTVQVVSMPGAL
jgi:hypothetical protein